MTDDSKTASDVTGANQAPSGAHKHLAPFVLAFHSLFPVFLFILALDAGSLLHL